MLEYEQNYTLKKVDIFTRQLPTQKHQFKPKRTDFRKISKKSSVLKNIDNLKRVLALYLITSGLFINSSLYTSILQPIVLEI